MNKKETATLMAILQVAYPVYYRNKTQDELMTAVNLWTEMFKEDDFKIVSAGVKSFIASDIKGFPPSIGAIKQYIQKITAPEELTEQEAWSLIKKALKNSSYNSKEEFEKLPQELQRLLGSPSQLKEWAREEISTLDSVIASNFMRSYRARIQSVREYNALPNDVKQMVGSLSTNMVLGTLDVDELKQKAFEMLE